MNKLSSDELKQVELSVLIQLDKICKEQNLRYWLTAGTLLGAIRHKGFIPWDDDIDIMMPRKDYTNLIRYCKTHKTQFDLLAHEIHDNYFVLFAKACDTNTIVHDFTTRSGSCATGVWVDIIPVDGLGNDFNQAEKVFKETRFRHYLLVASIWKKFFRSKSRSIIYEPIRFFFYVVGKILDKRKAITYIEKQCLKNDFDESLYCGCLCGSYGVFDRSILDETIEVEFEGRLFRVMKEYDQLLKYLYGDYMKLPPLDKQKTHHDFEAFWKDEAMRNEVNT